MSFICNYIYCSPPSILSKNRIIALNFLTVCTHPLQNNDPTLDKRIPESNEILLEKFVKTFKIAKQVYQLIWRAFKIILVGQ